ncbi:MAG TPA: hypothetical protein DEB30_02590 [Candidatus Peribacter riflensis]|uniref:riboflavin kinase n=1 Tax=Candidatus Peribacter riflensis TaxID=1735162 RepID=A0A0S1SLL4_9BACT|nr:MAG: Riboflavin biosynthesis protein RibF [Candidatus Peribacter riflensis]OGJ77065.1 MAG: hypothetical protein A2398_02985 [Candidatus Peribacteria bacterium RIFOXYB1_FULL_57_12]OGJ79077.1 MAG: hypothetical protein A2412_04710 [Candidatus Peribacteria bacterium RIFOXYC1_FULL_58_8]ALM11013.1 MAG: Riboflavin biosynthesis protein RibF [Candidatus Peribacter riflensis]ALM12116.1 MAG: Riboflavin biosynthesis protein RibF [Candidatus Peribacter riflensis]
MKSPASLSLPAFTARVVKGSGRGRIIGSPTLNLSLSDVPRPLECGIYACRVRWNRHTAGAAMHFGPRPVFRAGIACEVHVIGLTIRRAPPRIEVEVVKRLRNIEHFQSVELLQEQIARDIEQTKRLINGGK